jgi:pyrroline-5-carboxylate reductase
MTHSLSLLLVGCGKMGGALLERWKHASFISHIHVIAPHHAYTNEPTVTWHRNPESLPKNYTPDVIILAVKPQQLDTVLPDYRAHFAAANPLYISVAAGKNLSFYASRLGEHAHVVRAMPNTPALAGQGMTALCAVSTLPASSQKIAMDLMQAVGKTEWLPDESLMDAVTAISGCGPAYVFLFLESLINAGVAAGLPESMARTLALQTIAGSVALAEHTGKTFEQLRTQVASPGGATEAALKVLMKDDAMPQLIAQAAAAARKRLKELAG